MHIGMHIFTSSLTAKMVGAPHLTLQPFFLHPPPPIPNWPLGLGEFQACSFSDQLLMFVCCCFMP